MKLIVGLGNPGDEYKATRHNIGFIVLDNYIKDGLWKEKYNALYKDMMIDNEKVILVKPTTYMNLSGDAVIKFVNFYKIDPSDILVIHDDLDLPFGRIRIKFDSSSGGHNGIKSIINNLGTQKFGRLKIGISHNSNGDTKDYVLGHFTEEENQKLNKILPDTKKIIDDFIKYDINKAIENYNKNNVNK